MPFAVASSMPFLYIEVATPRTPNFPVNQEILVPDSRLSISSLERFRNAPFENMVKFVVDVRLKKIALGGEMHADAETVLLESGSSQADIWGGNLWPWDHPPRIEYIALINIRPSADNRSMEIRLDSIRSAVESIVHQWIDLP
jgi:hypothetical protein